MAGLVTVYGDAPEIHVVLDDSHVHTGQLTRWAVAVFGARIALHFAAVLSQRKPDQLALARLAHGRDPQSSLPNDVGIEAGCTPAPATATTRDRRPIPHTGHMTTLPLSHNCAR